MKYLISITGVFCILACLTFLLVLPGRLDPQGNQSSSCIRESLPPLANGFGMAVSAHYTVCDDFIHDSAVYVHVRGEREPESAKTLVFRYADDPVKPYPELSWLDPHTLSVSVGSVIQVTKVVQSLGDIKIVYSIGTEKIPRDVSNADAYELKMVGLGALVLLIVSVFACVKVLRPVYMKSGQRSVKESNSQ